MSVIEEVKAHNLTQLKERGEKEIKEASDEEGLTALHWSARKGYLDIVKYLVSLGVDIFIIITINTIIYFIHLSSYSIYLFLITFAD